MAHLAADRIAAPRRRAGLWTRLTGALDIWRQRKQLSELDAHLRADLGLTDRAIHEELARPVWGVPHSWRR